MNVRKCIPLIGLALLAGGTLLLEPGCTKKTSEESMVDGIPSEDDAKAKADKQITPDNANEEAAKLEKELDEDLK